jgi:hypothetical protein
MPTMHPATGPGGLVMRHGIRVGHRSRSVYWHEAFVPLHTVGSQDPIRVNVVPMGAAW